MNSKVEKKASSFDTIKLLMALIVVIASVVAYYYFADESQLLRIVGILVGVGIASAIILQTEKGRNIWSFIHDAQIEVRKVVWPTKQETVQTTILVIIVVFFVGLFLWLLDMFLTWGVQLLTGLGV